MFNLLKKKNKNLSAGIDGGTGAKDSVGLIAIDDKRIKTIPEKFLPAKNNKGGKYKFIIITVGILIVIVGVFTGLLLFSDDFNEIIFGKDKIGEIDGSNDASLPDVPGINGNEYTETAGEDNDSEKETENIKAAEIFRKEALDEQGRVAGVITFAMRSELEYIDLSIKAFSPEKETILDKNNNQFKIIGGVYSFEPGGVRLADGELLIKMLYNEQDLGDYKESDLKVLNWESEPEINFLTGNINELENLAEIKVSVLPKGKIALGMLMEDLKESPTSSDEIGTEEAAPIGALPKAEDSDDDGLTDGEEILYGMDASMPDTDGNGLDDEAEVLKQYAAELDKVLDPNLEAYNSETKEYSVYYPMLWAVEEIDGMVSFTADTGESVQISIQGNPQGFGARDWYLKQTSGVAASQIKSGEINGLDAAWSLDQFTCYIASGEDIYLINYSVGLRDEASFKTTFDGIVSSFYFPKMFITGYSYENKEYGFVLELPLSWEFYDVVELQKDWGNSLNSSSLMFRLASDYPEECNPYDKCAVFVIDIFDFLTWNDVRLLDNAPLLVNVNNDYVFAYRKSEFYASDLEERVGEVDDIIETFVFK